MLLRHKKYIISFILSILPFFSFAQNGGVNGFIYDATSGEPIAYAMVRLTGTNFGEVTEKSGAYIITKVPSGKYEIEVSYLGFQTIRDSIEIANMVAVRKAVGINNTSTYEQAASNKDYYAVEVTGSKGKLLAVVGPKASSYQPADNTWKKAISGYHYIYYVSGIDRDKINYPAFAPSTFVKYDITVNVNADQVGWSSVNFWTWGGDGSHSPKNGNWPGDKVTTTTEAGGKKWYTQTYTINDEDDAVSVVFSTDAGSPQTVDVADITSNKFFEISNEKDGDKYKVKDVTSSYTAIPSVRFENSDMIKVYTLDGRLLRKTKTGSEALNGLQKGVYIINNKKVIIR